MGFWDAVASAGPYANNLHLTPDRQPHQHLIAQFLRTGCFSWRPTYSVKALNKLLFSLPEVLQYFNGYMQNNTSLTYRDFLRVDGSVLPSTKELLNSKGRRQTDFIPANQANQTHTHPCNGPFSGTMQVSRYQKSKTNLDFTEARDSELQWHQLGHMQVCTSLQTENQASSSPLSFYRLDALPAAQPTASKHWRLPHKINTKN